MTSFLKSIASFAAVAFLAGCAGSPDQKGVPKNAFAHWRKGDFSIDFQAGPKPFGEEKSYSSFSISRQFKGLSNPTTIVVESGQDLEWFRWSQKRKSADFVRFFLSDSGLTMLIREIVPNDGGPCSNDILVRANEKDDGGRQLTYVYLSFPTGRLLEGSIFAQEAEITELTDAHVSYRYPDGTRKTQPFKALTKPEQRPTFP